MTSSYTVKYGYTLHEAENLVSGDTLDIFDANGEVLASFSPAASVDGYSFKYWCYRDGDTYKRFSYAYLLETNMTLYPMFGEDDVYADRPITIQYQLVDYSNNVVGTAQESVTASYRDAEGNLQFSAEGNIVVKDGDRVTYKAPDIAGYTHVDVSGTIYRVSEANHEIILRYRDASWKYDVEYYVQYENLENPASWVAAADYDEGLRFGTRCGKVQFGI